MVAALVLQTSRRGFDPHRSYSVFCLWGRSQTGKALVLQTRNCGFESHRLHSIFQGVGQRLPTCLGSKPTQVRILPPRLAALTFCSCSSAEL